MLSYSDRYNYEMDADFDALIQLEDDIQNENVLVADDQDVASKRVVPTRDFTLPDDGNIRKRLRLSEVPERPAIVPRKVLLRRVPLHGDYISITFKDGTRYYIRILEEEEGSENVPSFAATGLADQAHILSNSRRTAKSSDNQHILTDFSGHSSELWTVKYAPSHYLNLLSDETTNRTLLRWLKAWDSYVFGYSPPSFNTGNPRGLLSNINSEATNLQTANRFVHRTDELERMAGDIDPRDGLPRYRIVLLTGPPGVGKTTLAHKLAQHAGYQVIEVNASDDRNASAFRDQLAAVVSTVSTLDRADSTSDSDNYSKFKPSCLVLDEIDGAVPEAVELLVSAAQALPRPQHQHSVRRARKLAPLVLRRPVICICNDLYSPAVRPLRASGVPCLVLKLGSLDMGSLVARLDAVAREEGLSVDKMTLTNLAEVTNRDVRACLNVLQFLKSHEHAQLDEQSPIASLNMSNFTSLGGGLKDIQQTLLDAWRLVFTIPSPRLLAYRAGTTSTTAGRSSLTQLAGSRLRDSDKGLSTRIKYVMDTVNAVGEHSSVAMGIFENYLQARMKDASLNVARQASDWFVFHDLLSQRIYSHADYSLLRYSVWLPAWFHLTLATPLGLTSSGARGTTCGRPGLRWPTAHTDSAASRLRCQAVLEQLLFNQWQASPPVHTAEASGHTSAWLRCLSQRDLLLDVMPSAVSLVSLTALSLRPLNAQLYSRQEKQSLAHLVQVMLSLGLDWRVQQQADSDNGDYSASEVDYLLEPPVHEVVSLGSDRASSALQKTVSFTTKQLVARELRLERVRRSEHSIHSRAELQQQPVTTSCTTLGGLTAPMFQGKPTAAQLPADSKRLKVKRDFFGRVLADASKPSAQVRPSTEPTGSTDANQASHSIFFQFQEGYSNAVRRPVTMKQLL